MTDEYLKPCPFCGETEEIKEDGAGILGTSEGFSNWVVCETCGGCGPVLDDNAQAAEAWNRRHEPK